MTAKKKTVKKVKKPDTVKIDACQLLSEMHARFDAIGEKLDALVAKTASLMSMVGTERDPGFKTEATVNKKFPIPQDNPPRERKMHKAICADCGASCEVPFVPKPDRPVYCKTCFTGRKKDNNAKNVPSREEIVAEISRTLNIDMDAAPKAPQGKTEKASRGAAAKKGKAKRSKGRK